MTRRLCCILPPRMEKLERTLDARGTDMSCILPLDRCESRHVFRQSDGSYILWEDDYECGCCEPEDDERCYVYEEITEEDYKRMAGIE